VNADRLDRGPTSGGVLRPDGQPDRSPSGPARPPAGRMFTLDRVTLQLGVAVAVVIATCSYAVSATSLYALGRQAGYVPWQAVAVPVVADGPAIYGMFRIVSRSRRRARGASYGWLLVGCGTLASIGGNVAHAQPDLVAQGIAAAIPLAALAMLEGLKGDACEVTRLTTPPSWTRTVWSHPVSPVSFPRAPPCDASTPPPAPTVLWWPAAPGRQRCQPGPARSPGPRSGRDCRRPMGRGGRTASPGRPAPWPRLPAAAAAAPPASCNASPHRPQSPPHEPAESAAA
jgi:hypothetical protein